MKNKTRIILTLASSISFLVIVFVYLNNDKNEVTFEDKNKNGIWDEADDYIAKTAQTEIQKKALAYNVKAYQDILLNPNIGKDVKNGSVSQMKKSGACVDKVWGGSENAPNYKALEKVILNSGPRLKAYIKYNSNLSGGVYSLWDEERDGNPCPNEVN